MKRMAQDQTVVGRNDGFARSVLQSPARLGPHGIHLGEVFARGGYRLGVGTQRVGELGEQAHDLATLGVLQFAKRVVKLHHLDGFYVESLARGRLVVDKSVQLALVARRHGDHGAAVAHGDHRLGIHYARALGVVQHLLQPLGHLPLVVADSATHGQQLGRGAVANMPLVVDELVDAAYHVGEDAHPLAALAKPRVTPLGTAQQETHHVAHRRQGAAQHGHFGRIEESPLDADLLHNTVRIGEFVARSVGIEHHQHAHLVGGILPPLDLLARRGKVLRLDNPPRGLHAAHADYLFAKPIETDLLLEISGIYHNCRSLN